MEVALDNGADDVVSDEDGSIEVTCDPSAFEALHKAFTDKGWEPEVAEVTWKSESETVLTGDDAERMQRLIDALEDLDDVSEVYTTAVFEKSHEDSGYRKRWPRARPGVALGPISAS